MTQYYPGSSQARSMDPLPPPELGGGRVFKMADGTELTLFGIAELAAALNRTTATIRRWEREGVIPKAVYKKSGKDIHGKRRYYSQEQILGLARIAHEEGIWDNPRASISNTQFSAKALRLFQELRR